MTSQIEGSTDNDDKAARRSKSRLLGYAEPVAAAALATLAALGANGQQWGLVLGAFAVSAILAAIAAGLDRGGRIEYIRGRAAWGACLALAVLGAWAYALVTAGAALLRWVSQ